MTAQRKRIFVTTGQVANTKHAHQGFEFVGQGHHQADLIARQFVACKTWAVVVFNGVGNVMRQTIVARIVAAHDALQLREFAHHVCQQICFGQLRCSVCSFCQRITPQGLTQSLGNAAHACHALALCAQLVVIHHFVQTLNARSQSFLAVLVKEEFGIGQTGSHHALVATNDGAGVCWRNVADHQELVRQLSFCGQQREIFLIGLHGQDQTFLRHF